MTKIACVTGVTSGIGQAAARRFIREGWRVVGTGRRPDRLAALAQELGVSFYPLRLDVRERDAVTAAFTSLPPEFSLLDVLVNNAGLALGMEPAPEASLQDWDTMVDTNIKGLYTCTRAVLPAMVKRGQGHIVNIGSTAGNYPYPGGNVYGSTKAFVRMFSSNLRCDLHGSGVRVTNIEPGMLESEFSLIRFKGDRQKAAGVYQDTLPLTPEDVADAVYYAVSRPARVNICRIEVMPTVQSNGPLRVARTES
jgi:NADP-dependent 3-hydroxy acid dehydrogenase YdfG